MRVLINCLSARSGGALAYLRNLLPELAAHFSRSESEHRLVLLRDREQSDLIGPLDGVEVETAPWKRCWPAYRMLWENVRVPRIVAKHGAEVVFIPYQVGMRLKGIRQVLMLRNLEPFFYDRYDSYGCRARARNRLLRMASIRSLGEADRVIAVSDYARQYAVGRLGLAGSRIRKIYHGHDESFRPSGDANEDALHLAGIGVGKDYILTSGSLLPYRRCEDVISAFSRSVACQYPQVKLVIAGSGNDGKYRDLLASTIAHSGHADRILALGQVSYDLMKVLYRRCRYFVAATEIEACPNTILEAMGSGCPILSAATPPLPEILGDAAVTFRPRDIQDLGEKMTALWANEDLLLNLRYRSLRQIGDFSWSRSADSTFDALVNW